MTLSAARDLERQHHCLNGFDGVSAGNAEVGWQGLEDFEIRWCAAAVAGVAAILVKECWMLHNWTRVGGLIEAFGVVQQYEGSSTAGLIALSDYDYFSLESSS